MFNSIEEKREYVRTELIKRGKWKVPLLQEEVSEEAEPPTVLLAAMSNAELAKKGDSETDKKGIVKAKPSIKRRDRKNNSDAARVGIRRRVCRRCRKELISGETCDKLFCSEECRYAYWDRKPKNKPQPKTKKPKIALDGAYIRRLPRSVQKEIREELRNRGIVDRWTSTSRWVQAKLARYRTQPD